MTTLGNVKWFNDKKGYGFITTEQGEDIFVHYSSIKEDGRKSLEDGQKVSFEIYINDRGKYALNVTKVD